MKKTFIFDYDDTLAPNQHYYSLAQHKFVGFVLDKLGPRTPCVQEIINLQVGIDVELVKSRGFSQNRFPESFRLAYHRMREKLGLEKDPEGEASVYLFGDEVYNRENWRYARFFPGVTQTLAFLEHKGDELMVLTKGDLDIQKAKLQATRAFKWFGDLNGNRVFIVPGDKKPVLESIVTHRNKDLVWVVGNSLKSDIIPALDLGVGAIYVPQETWAYEKHDDTSHLNHPRLRTFKEVEEIISNYDSLV